MKIKYLPPSPKAGISEHVDNATGATLVRAGFAEEIKPAPRGTPEWLKEQAEREEIRVAQIPEGQKQNIDTRVRWTVDKTDRKQYVIVRRVLTEKTIFGPKPVMINGNLNERASEHQFIAFMSLQLCPKEIIDQWLRLKNEPNYLAAEAARIEQEKRAAAEQAEREKHAPRFI